MKLVRNIGDKAIVLLSNDLKNELDMDAVTSIDHANLILNLINYTGYNYFS